MPKTTRQWIYGKPLENGKLGPQQFELREVTLPQLQDGDALVRVKLVNIHSNTRMRMATRAIPLGETDAANYACAEVIEPRTAMFHEGDVIACQTGWQEYQVISTEAGAVGHGIASELTKTLNGTNSPWTYKFRPAMVKMWPAEVLMEMFGTSGMTAYFGVRECGPLMPGSGRGCRSHWIGWLHRCATGEVCRQLHRWICRRPGSVPMGRGESRDRPVH